MTHPFTPTYIAMAKAAEEIQAMRAEVEVYGLGDWFLGDHGPELCDRSTLCLEPSPAWLPRLDQLLGMLGSPKSFFEGALFERDDGCLEVHFGGEGSDWHELALAVIMREKHGKTWDEKGWVKA